MDRTANSSREVIYLDSSLNNHEVRHLLQVSDWKLNQVADFSSAEDMLNEHPCKVGLISLTSNECQSINQLENFLSHHDQLCWVALVTPEALDDPSLRTLIQNNCYDYCTLPIATQADILCSCLGHAYGMACLRSEHSDHSHEIREYEMVGTSGSMLTLFQNVRKFSQVDAPVLISGETGTGKELVAQAIHERSQRADKPFVAVNCGALPDSLVQSELFGYEKGAFTGAVKTKMGHIEAATTGTLFLDEIGDLPLEQQVNLLRFLQEGTIERVGSTSPIKVDVRVIAATHVDLEAAVARGDFREDLYFRLNVLSLTTPPIRERQGDIEILARFFFKEFHAERNKQIQGFSQQAIHAMNSYHWPGNVRELINRIRRAVVMSDNRLITPQDLGLKGINNLCLKSLSDVRSHAEADAIRSALNQSKSNVSEAAKSLNVSRVTLYRLMKKYGIDSDSGRLGLD